jgi:hypothetical protein
VPDQIFWTMYFPTRRNAASMTIGNETDLGRERCEQLIQPQTAFHLRGGMAWKFQRSLVIVDNLAAEKISREVVLRPNESSHDKVFWKLSTGATYFTEGIQYLRSEPR